MSEARRVLVTGATGFIGKHVMGALRARGVEAVGIGHEIDLTTDAVQRLLDEYRPTQLLHLAWYAVHGKFWRSMENYRWAAATVELARRFAEGGGKRIVAAGTCVEYGDHSGVCNEAETPPRPVTPYGVCKDATRRLLESLATESGLSFAWGRIFSLYGPGEKSERLVPSVIRSLLAGERAACSAGTQVRDYLHVRDVAEAFVDILLSGVTGPVNVASGQGRTVRQIASCIGRLLGAEDRLDFGAFPARPEPAVIVGDSRRLRNEAGWKPRFDLEAGLADTIQWFRAEASR